MSKHVAVEMKGLPVNIGIGENARRQIANGLGRLLADTFTLYLKTHNFHWNVVGPQFQPLHSVFEEQYTQLWKATDELAERMRALGFPAPGSLHEFQRLATVTEEEGVPAAEEMIRQLVEGHEVAIRTARAAFPAAEQGDDQATMNLIAERLDEHEKTAWMLRSLLA